MSDKVFFWPSSWEICCLECGFHHIPRDGRWQFNGDIEHPTFTPSMNEVSNSPSNPNYQPDAETSRCHFILTNGVMNYCSDSTHKLAGQSVELQAFTEAQWESRRGRLHDVTDARPDCNDNLLYDVSFSAKLISINLAICSGL